MLNEFVLFILSVLCQSFVMSYFIYSSTEIIKKEKISLKKKIILFDVMCVSTTIGMLLRGITPINTLFLLITLILVSILLLKSPKVLSSILSIGLVLIFLISELGAALLFSKIIGKPITEFMNCDITLFLVSIFQSALIFISLFIIKKLINIKQNHTMSYRKTLFLVMFIALVIVPNIILLAINKYNFPSSFLLYIFILISTIFILSFTFIKKYVDIEIYKNSIKDLEMSNNNLTSLVDGVRTIKHDLNNIFQAINGYVALENYDGLKKYLTEFTNECNILNSKSIINKEILDDPAIYGVVGSKHFVTSEKNILLELEIVESFQNIEFPMSELSRILGVLLDNAIEATEKIENKFVKLEVRFDPRKNAHLIKIYNTYDTNINIDLDKIFEKGYSSKKIKSGIGLWEIKKIIKRYKHTQIFASIENDKFIQHIIIEKK